MGYEVDVIGVGDESKSGDAIAVRWGNLFGAREEQKVVIIDGGFRESGQDVVNHVRGHYRTNVVDVVISTHPDQDHVNGLHEVLDELSVWQLWIHKPWEHTYGLAGKFADGRLTDSSLGQRLRESHESASDLVWKAERKNILVVEPFAGLSLHNQQEFCVLGPTAPYYESLIPEFDGMPKEKKELTALIAELASIVPKTVKRLVSTWGVDVLDDNDTTSAENNSSVITALTVEGQRLLFTGDAGVTALSHAADHLDFSFQNAQLRFFQIPHHGSRRNVGPTVLNRLIGYPLPQGHSRSVTAIASTAKRGEPKHPRKAVMNAFTHRGVKAIATRGCTTLHFHNAPARQGWIAATPDDYHWTYDDEE